MELKDIWEGRDQVYNVADYGGTIGSNCRTAINDTIAAALTDGGGIVQLLPGIMLCNGAVDGAGNQIYFPDNPYATTENLTRIKIRGTNAPNFYANPFDDVTSTGNNPEKCSIIRSDLLGVGNVIGSAVGTGIWSPINNFLHVEIEGVAVEVRSKTGGTDVAPEATGINMGNVAYADFNRVAVRTTSRQDLTVQPATTAYGFVFPKTNNFCFVSARNCLVYGMYVGFDCYEHTYLEKVFADACNHGMQFNAVNHAIQVVNAIVARCKYGLKFNQGTIVNINGISFESDPLGVSGAWHQTQQDVSDWSDTAGSAKANILLHRVRSNIGSEVDSLLRENVRNNIICQYVGDALPRWKTAQRPLRACMGFNTTDSKVEYSHDGTTFTQLT